MRRAFVIAAPLVAALATLAVVNAVYLVGQAQQVVVVRLGEPVAVVNGGPVPLGAGLHLKWPFLERVTTLDRRSRQLQTSPTELAAPAVTALQAEMRYRVRDPLRFYRALGDEGLGEQRLSERLQDSLKRVLPSAGVPDLTSARPGLDKALLADLRNQSTALGVEILDAHLVDGPPSSSTLETLARRMQDAETGQVAQIRADGEAHKRELLAQADRDAADVRGEGERQALEVRGDGDAQRAAILGAAYGEDPAFARFFRRLEAYDQAFNPDNTTLVLSPDNAFLDLFAHGPGGTRKPPG